MDNLEVAALVACAKRGDRIAFGDLVVEFQPTIYAVALHMMRNPNDAQDLSQDVFTHALSKLRQLRENRCFASWLKQMTVRMGLNRLTRNRLLDSYDTDSPGKSEEPLDLLVMGESRETLRQNLLGLKPLDRQSLSVFYLEGLSLKQMSQKLHVPVGTLKRRLHVARHRLREIYMMTDLVRTLIEAEDLDAVLAKCHDTEELHKAGKEILSLGFRGEIDLQKANEIDTEIIHRIASIDYPNHRHSRRTNRV